MLPLSNHYPASTSSESNNLMFKRIAGWFGWIVLVIVIITVAFVLISTRKGWQFAAVLSGSMRPEFQVGGLVVIKPADVSTLKVGEVISFMKPAISNNTAVCHRIVAIQYQNGQEYFETKGDANNAPDQGLTPASYVKGKEILYIPYAGRLVEVKSVGSTRISMVGKQIPLAVIVITAIGLLFIGLILQDTIESILWPGRQWQREANKKRKERLAARRKTFNL
jgi:signal peptidase I